MVFRDPVFFILIPVVIAASIYARKRDTRGNLRFSSGALLSGLKRSFKARIYKNLIFLRLAVLLLLVFALGRPQSPVKESKIQIEGIDIVLAIDSSTSMLAEDFIVGNKRQNRIEVVKAVVGDFIRARKSDRIALVSFAARAYTVSPLTLDYSWLLQNLERVKSGLIEDGTAIGAGVAASLNRLKDTKAKSKIIILLTDGRNNAGSISPFVSAEAAKALGVKVYTIGAGAKGPVPYPMKDFFGNTVYQNVQIDIDEDTLKKIADTTGAKYYRATDTASLREIYKEIDRLEKTTIEEKGYSRYDELFAYFLISALALLVIEIVLSNTVFRRIP